MPLYRWLLVMALWCCLADTGPLNAAIREVGPGKTYTRIEAAYQAANAGDSILVYPQSGGAVYDSVAVFLTKRKLAVLGIAAAGQRVLLHGDGFDYSGSGSVPRAMFQFNPGADSCAVENFEISGCHNASYNGAAFRINQVNNITIRNCHVHDNDMGVMSNGTVAANSAAHQLIENCIVHDNGNTADPGYNHNFYVGGTSVTIRGCDVYAATTGHDIKSRAHITIVEGCYVHDCQNREFDLVDDNGVTTVAASHALIAGCVIVKAANASGNKTTIHFGQDGGFDHNGTLYVVHCTIVTPYISPVVDLSAPGAGVSFTNCLVLDPSDSASGQVLVSTRGGALISNAVGSHMWMSSGFSAPAGGVFDHVTKGAAGNLPKFIDAASGNYALAENFAGIVDAGLDFASIFVPQEVGNRLLVAFLVPLGSFPRAFEGAPDIGAYEFCKTCVTSSISPSMPGFSAFTVRYNRANGQFVMKIDKRYLRENGDKFVLSVYTMLGKKLGSIKTVGTLGDGCTVIWKLRDLGAAARSGAYVFSLEKNGRLQNRRVVAW
jgi:hypothetical protein